MTPAEFHAARKFAETSFGRIAHFERGAGAPAVFLHGLPLCSYQWRDVVESVAAPTRRCIALDTMGLGYTEVAPGQDVSFAAQAQMLAAFLDAKAIDRVDLVGNDTGAGISQVFAATHPERVRSLTLTNCEVHDLWPNALLRGFYEGVATGAVPAGFRRMLDDLALAHAQLGALVYEDAATLTSDGVRVCLAPLVSSDARVAQLQGLCDWPKSRAELVACADRQKTSTIPTQVIWGDGDVVFDAQPSLAWLEANLGGLRKITRVPGAKLFFPEEHPQLVSRALEALWSSV
jgi:haloalkane dehalogenase